MYNTCILELDVVHVMVSGMHCVHCRLTAFSVAPYFMYVWTR